MGNKALIVIDIQNDYFPGGKWTLDGIEDAAANAGRLIGAARVAGELVVHIRHEFTNDAAPFFTPGSDGAKTHADVAPAGDEAVVLKHKVNSFQDTDLRDLLERNGIEKLVICGAMSHMCVDGTTRAASDLGYDCTLIHDACATRALEFDGLEVPASHAHAAFMSALGFAYASVVSTEQYLSGAA